MNLNPFRIAVAVAFLAMTALGAVPDYRYGAGIAVEGTAAGVTLANFPVLVRISPSRIAGFAYSQLASPADGADLRFTDASGNFLNHDIDTWNTNGESLVWVSVPSLARGATLSMRWGNRAPAEANAPAAVWSAANYAAVLHLGDAGSVAADACGNYPGSLDTNTAPAANGRIGAATTTSLAASSGNSETGGGVILDGTADVTFGSAMTISGWIRHNALPVAGDRIFARRTRTGNATSKDGFEVRIEAAGADSVHLRAFGGDPWNPSTTNIALRAGEWLHLAVSYPGGWNKPQAYTNGAAATLTDKGFNVITDNGEPISFGQSAGGAGYAFHGEMDECRIRLQNPGAAWFAEEYATVADDAYLTFGAITDNGGPYIAFLRENASDTLPDRYGEPETIFSDVSNAVVAAVAARNAGRPSATLYVAPGTYRASGDALRATNGVSIIGIGTREETVVTGPEGSDVDNWNHRVMLLSDGGFLANVTILGTKRRGWDPADKTDGNWNRKGAALLLEGDGTTASNIVVRNSAAKYGWTYNEYYGAVCLLGSSQLLDSLVAGNRGGFNGAGVAAFDHALVRRCVVVDNEAECQSSSDNAYGGGVFLTDYASLVDCLVARNRAGTGAGGVYHRYGQNDHGIFHCTIVSNSAPSIGAILACNPGDVGNSIVWGNVSDNGSSVITNSNAPLIQTYRIRSCCLQEELPPAFALASGNFVANPRFRNFANGDYTLRGDSPCIDAGETSPKVTGLGPATGWTSLNGVPHSHDDGRNDFSGLPDLGCYESLYWSARPTNIILR